MSRRTGTIAAGGKSTLPQSRPRNKRDRAYLVGVLALGLVACLALLAGELYFLDGRIGFPLDDSWIHLQFARNLKLGDGLTYNPGEPVAGSTAPLWTAVLAILHLLPGSVIAWVKLVGIALHLAGIHAVFVVARELGLRSGLAAFAAAMTALTSWLLWSALSGMEVPLFVWLSLWGIIFQIRERRRNWDSSFALPVLALAALARPEGMLLFALSLVDRLVIWERSELGLALRLGSWQAVLKGCLASVVLLAPVAVFNLRFSGSVLPTTFSAKSTGLTSFLPDLRYVYEVMNIFMKPQPYLLLLSLAGVLLLFERLGSERDGGLLPGLWLIALPLAYSTLGAQWEKILAGNFGRYYYPLFPVVIALGTLALARAAAALGPRLRVGKLAVPLRAAVAALILWPTVSAATTGAGLYIQAVGNVEDGDVRIARWLSGRVDPRAVLAVNDVGAIKYLLPNRVIDVAGIIHPQVPRYIHQAIDSGQDWRSGVLRFLEEEQPDFLVIFPNWYPNLSQLDARYQPQFELEIPGNIAMGSDSIVVYTTPWTRYPLVPGTLSETSSEAAPDGS